MSNQEDNSTSEYEQHKFNSIFQFRDQELNAVSPTFCLAKWLQSTVTLYNGHTHSCHHPRQHRIDPKDLVDNPAGLHNTPVKFHARSEMLQGIQTGECDYCWNIENLPGNHLSDRTYKSGGDWARPFLKEAVDSGVGHHIAPKYLEIAFETTCNFKCAYCSPDVSSGWMGEIQQHGGYQVTDSQMHNLDYLKRVGRIPIRHDEVNPYIDAFWSWWPTIYPELHTFRITGGEPLLSKHTWKVLDYIEQHPRPDLVLAINTNMNVPDKLVDKLIGYVNRLHGKVKRFEVYTSCEAHGPAAEYIRHGMNFEEFSDNCERFLRQTPNDVHLHFMTTINILSCGTFIKFLNWLMRMRGLYHERAYSAEHPEWGHYPVGEHRVRVMFNYVRWPRFMNLRALTKNLKEDYAAEWLRWSSANGKEPLSLRADTLFVEEQDQIQRLVEFMRSDDDNLLNNRKDFSMFFEQYDQRRGTNFRSTFPELSGYMNLCAALRSVP